MVKRESDISLVLVTKYASEVLKICLDSFFRNSKINHELIIIADDPSWQVIKVLQDRLLDYEIVSTGHFFLNCNIGAKKATRKYIGFVNDDVVFGPSWDVSLQMFIDTQRTALLSSNLLTTNNGYSFGYQPYDFNTFNVSDFERYARGALKRTDIDSHFWMPLLVPKIMFDKYNGYTTFSSQGYGHENNLENIIRKKENIPVITIMASTIYHFGASSNMDKLNRKYGHPNFGYFICTKCGKEEKGIFNDADQGKEMDNLRTGNPWICFECRTKMC